MDGGRCVSKRVPLRRNVSMLERQTVRGDGTRVFFEIGNCGEYYRMVGGRDILDGLLYDENGRTRTEVGGGRKRIGGDNRDLGGWPYVDGCQRFGALIRGYFRGDHGGREYDGDGCSRGRMERQQPYCRRCAVGDNDDGNIATHSDGDDGAHDHPGLRVHRKRQRCHGRRDNECA